MKNLVTKTIFTCLVLVAGLMASCNDDETPIGTLTTPTNLEYTVIDHSEVELNWDATENAESYTIEVFLNGNLDFEGTPIEVISDVTDNAYTLINLSSDTEFSVRICAVSSTFNQSEWVGVTFKTDEEQQKQVLYLTGDVINGVAEWVNSADAIGKGLQVLFADNNEDNTYTYTGLFNGRKEFKLPTIAGSNNGQYGYSSSDFKLELNNIDRIAGPGAAGYYTLSVNLSELTVDFSPYNAGATAPTYNSMGIYGNATPGGWSTETRMTGVSPHIWVIKEVELTKGEFLFRANNASTDYWSGTSSNDLPFGKAVKSGTGTKIEEAGTYFVQFNDLTGHYIIIKTSDMKVVAE